jgi:hypothetical protein
MRELPGVGVEYGLTWIRDYIVEDNLTSVDLDAVFEESIDEMHSEPVKVGWIEVDVSSAIKRLCPTSWEIAQDEWVDQQLEDGLMMSFDQGSTCYWTHDVERFLDIEAPVAHSDCGTLVVPLA